MDLSKIKARLEALNQDNSGNGGNNSDKFWKPELGKSVVRIVPSAYDPENPFTELKFHTVISKFPILALSNLGQQDPVDDFIKKLREQGGKENWSLSGKLTPRSRYFVPVIVRGEEDRGVRFWNIGITIYKALLQLAAEEEVGDYTDIVNGRDITVTKVKGDPYPETSIMPKMSTSPLSGDPKLVKKWLEDQPKVVDCFRKPDYEYIKKTLEAYLTGSSTVESNPITEAGEKVAAEHSAEGETPKEEFKVETKPAAKKAAPKSVTAQFNDLFGDETAKSDEELPF